jgi:general secretion pathway protein D
LVLFVAASFVGCAGRQDVRKAEKYSLTEDWDQAVLHYARAVAQNPENLEYRMKLMRARIKAAQVHIERAKKYHVAGLYPQAAEEYQHTLALDPTSQFAADELQKVLAIMEEEVEAQQLGMSLEEMKEEAAKITPTPHLNPQANIPIKLKFADQDLKDIFTALCKAAGVNVLFDATIADKKISVDLQDVTFLEALDILNIQTGTFYKIINSYTIIIAPDNRQKRQEYDDQVIKTFYLSNAEAKGVFGLLRGLIDARNVAQNDELNAITIKDTPDKIAVAERIIGANDKAKGEVVIDVELMEVKRMRRRDIGVELPQSLKETFNIADGGVLSKGSDIRLNELDLLNKQYNWVVGVPSLTYNFFKSVTEANTIARPQLRVTEGEKANINIGDQVPIPTTTYNVGSTVGGIGGAPITNFTYQNVGVQISVEPRVHHNQEITLKVQIEVSSITGEVQAAVGAQPIIGTRSIDTIIRLKDGQVNILAGLIRDDERDSLSGVPGLGDTPILRRLFGNTSRSKEETDIVLSLTPHIVRMPNITSRDLEALWVGSGDRIRLMEKPSPSVLLGKGGTPSPPKRPEPAGEAEEKVEREAPQAPPDEAPEEPPAPKEPPRPPKPAVLRIVPRNHTMKKGEESQIEITIGNGVDVVHAPLVLGYNAEILHVLDVVELGYLRQGDAPITFVRSIDNDKGSAVVGYSRQAPQGVSGDGMLVRVTLKGMGVGASPFFLTRSELRNSQNRKTPVSLVHGRVKVTEGE